MGAQNHQPTNRNITAASAWLSQKIGEAYIDVLEANNRLEDAIILGMNKLHVTDFAVDLIGTPIQQLRSSIELFQRSIERLSTIRQAFKRLREAANREGYVGNALANQLPNLNFEKQFSGKLVLPEIKQDVWNSLVERISKDNILHTLNWEADQFELVVEPTLHLIETLQECRKIAEEEGNIAFVNAVENNELPIRQYGAQVFSLWNHLSAMFLYSAIIMTELFYRSNNYPSLTVFNPNMKRHEVA